MGAVGHGLKWFTEDEELVVPWVKNLKSNRAGIQSHCWRVVFYSDGVQVGGSSFLF